MSLLRSERFRARDKTFSVVSFVRKDKLGVTQKYNIKEGKAKCYGDITVSEVYQYDIDSTAEELDRYCK